MSEPPRGAALPRWVPIAALVAIMLFSGLWAALRPDPPADPPSPAETSQGQTSSDVQDEQQQTSGEEGEGATTGADTGATIAPDIPTCDWQDLPATALDTIADIEAGGPYEFSRDGLVFENREGLLPDSDHGYYHEYTVITPGAQDRGARRIVTGGEDPAVADLPDWWLYTEDHYASFCQITGVD